MVVVTGASSGIGKATALAFARKGAPGARRAAPRPPQRGGPDVRHKGLAGRQRQAPRRRQQGRRAGVHRGGAARPRPHRRARQQRRRWLDGPSARDAGGEDRRAGRHQPEGRDRDHPGCPPGHDGEAAGRDHQRLIRGRVSGLALLRRVLRHQARDRRPVARLARRALRHRREGVRRLPGRDEDRVLRLDRGTRGPDVPRVVGGEPHRPDRALPAPRRDRDAVALRAHGRAAVRRPDGPQPRRGAPPEEPPPERHQPPPTK